MSDFLGGISAMVARVQKVKDAKVEGSRRAIYLALRNTLNVSNSQVPHEEGDLERDGTVSVDERGRRGAISYGHDPLNGIKAIVQHEDMTLKHDAGRNAKYLENALNSTRAQNAEIIAREIRAEMGT